MKTLPTGADEINAAAEAKAASRVNWIDAAKGIGIILVVVGHTNRGLAYGILDWASFFKGLDTWIYSFHMPLFFFLSGLFLVKSSAKPYSIFLSDKLRTVAYPYFVWSILTIAIKSPLGYLPHSPRTLGDLPLIVYSPIEQYWFLYVLFITTTVLGALYHIGLSPRLIAVLACAFSASFFSLPWPMFDLAREYMIYVAFGAAIGSAPISAISWRYLPPAIAIGFALSLFALGQPFVALAAIAAVTATAVMIDRTRVGAVLAFFGKYSLEIFVAHTIVSAGARVVLQTCGITSPIAHIAVGICAGLLLPIAMARALENCGFEYAFTFPWKQRRTETTGISRTSGDRGGDRVTSPYQIPPLIAPRMKLD